MLKSMKMHACWLGLLGLIVSVKVPAKFDYTVDVADDARSLTVRACATSNAPAGRLYSGYPSADRYLDQLAGDGASAPLMRDGVITHGALQNGECLRYRVDAYSLAQQDRYRLSWRPGEYLRLPLQSWLWRPRRLAEGSIVSITLPAGWSASLPYARIEAQRWRMADTPLDWDGGSAFGQFVETRRDLPGGALRVSVLPPADAAARQRIDAWITLNARALLAASGRLPLTDVQVLVVPLPGVRSPVPWGQVMRGGGSALTLFVGLDADEEALLADWTLAHEFSHLLHPYLHTRGRWLSEGLASYYQNVLRARSGALSAEQAWQRLDAGFARGRYERSGGRALRDAAVGGWRNTMRVYWSGAAFWLEVELALRERGLADLSAVLDRFAARHLPSRRQWPPEAFIAELDAIVGADVLGPLFARYDAGTQFPSLTSTYRQLGLGADIGDLALTDVAPQAHIRDAIMRGGDGSIGALGQPSRRVQ